METLTTMNSLKNIFGILLIFNFHILYAQSFELSGNCQDNKNVYCSEAQTSYMNKDNIRAVFIFSNGRTNCTGTMINQFYDAGGVLRQYFITADHCFKDTDLNNEWELIFNYQSFDCNNSSIPNTINIVDGNIINARGIQSRDNWDSFKDWNTYPSNFVIPAFTRYIHTSKVRRVANNSWVDGALFEILTPIPPHFNVYYAGWDVTFNPFGVGLPKYVIHHPKGDIKKVAYTPVTIDVVQNAVCHIIFTIVDAVLNFFFGWLIEFRIQTICTYLENPRIVVPFFTSGITEKGSSGSALFSTGNKISAILNGGFGTCNVPVAENFGRLHSFWNASGSLRTALDRRQKTYLENAFGFVTGIDGQQPSCYSGDPLVLNGNYFPANEYQPENRITINAATKALLASGSGHNGGNLRAFSGSDFVINSPDIEIGNGNFDVDANANFELNNQSCNPANARMEMQDEISNCNIKKVAFDDEFQSIYADIETLYELEANPNPASDVVNINFNLSKTEIVKLYIYSSSGSLVLTEDLGELNEGKHSYKLDTRKIINGSYVCKFQTESYVSNIKIIILK